MCPAPPLSGSPLLVPGFMRARGEIRAGFLRLRNRTAAHQLFEQGGFRLKFPKRSSTCEAVVINTGGGMAGGDRLDCRFDVLDDAVVTLTTQSAEKIYRSQGPDTSIDIALSLSPGARLEWLPQETILFDNARLARSLSVDLADTAALTIAETLVFGRRAMNETFAQGMLRDRWRIRRQGRLVFAEDIRLDGDIAATLMRPACGGGASALATLVHIAPDAERQLTAIREALGRFGPLAAGSTAGLQRDDPWLEAGASAWNGMLVLRLAAAAPALLRTVLGDVLVALRGSAAPRVWQ